MNLDTSCSMALNCDMFNKRIILGLLKVTKKRIVPIPESC
jgi:hypothetical protein